MRKRTPVRVVAEDLNQHQAAKQALAARWPLFFLRYFALFHAHQIAPFYRAPDGSAKCGLVHDLNRKNTTS